MGKLWTGNSEKGTQNFDHGCGGGGGASQMVVVGALNVTLVVEVDHQRGEMFQQGAVHFGIYWENCAL